MDVSGDFEKQLIQGVEVIVWQWMKSDKHMDKNILKKRKSLKDKIGGENKNMPMLDMKMTNSRLEYCDIIMATENFKPWQAAVRQFYSSAAITETGISGGIQYTVTVENNALATLSFYHKTNRIMIQPINCEEANLLLVLRDIPAIRALLVEEKQVDHITVKPVYQTTPCKSNSSTSTRDTHNEPAASNMVVILPPLEGEQTQTCSRGQHQETDNPSVSTEQNIIHISEMLCFMQNRLLSLPVDYVIKGCLDFYSATTISIEKQKLFNPTEGHRPSR